MESAYALANRELEEIRNANHEELSRRRHEVISKEPKIAEIENELMKCGTRLLECVLKKTSDFEEIKANIQKLQAEKLFVLEKNGFSPQYLDDIYSCKECRDTGFIGGRRCSCLKALILKHIGANSNLTEHMRNQTFENFDFSLFEDQQNDSAHIVQLTHSICKKAKSFADTFDETHENILLTGNAGTGKTFVSSCIANHALERGKTVYYQTAYKLFEFFEKDKFSKDSEEDTSEIIKYIYDADLLIIDDLGTEFVTQFTLAAFFDIINSRIISGKSTIISTNLNFEELATIYSHRITSRFVGEYTLLQTVGKDLRSVLRAKRTAKI